MVMLYSQLSKGIRGREFVFVSSNAMVLGHCKDFVFAMPWNNDLILQEKTHKIYVVNDFFFGEQQCQGPPASVLYSWYTKGIDIKVFFFL